GNFQGDHIHSQSCQTSRSSNRCDLDLVPWYRLSKSLMRSAPKLGSISTRGGLPSTFGVAGLPSGGGGSVPFLAASMTCWSFSRVGASSLVSASISALDFANCSLAA